MVKLNRSLAIVLCAAFILTAALVGCGKPSEGQPEEKIDYAALQKTTVETFLSLLYTSDSGRFQKLKDDGLFPADYEYNTSANVSSLTSENFGEYFTELSKLCDTECIETDLLGYGLAFHADMFAEHFGYDSLKVSGVEFAELEHGDNEADNKYLCTVNIDFSKDGLTRTYPLHNEVCIFTDGETSTIYRCTEKDALLQRDLSDWH